MKTINLHTHFPVSKEQTGIVNHPVQLDFSPVQNQFYSIGFHPWDITIEPYEKMIVSISNLAENPQVIAIGECGIDRSIETDTEVQKAVFLSQVEIAEKINKPLIIHAVKSYSDLLQIKKERKNTVPWILHGYKGTPQTTMQLSKAGFYFSLGKSLLKDEEKQNQSLKIIPLYNLFFETDKSTVHIDSIYIFAASVLGISVDKLKKAVFNNFQQIFKI